MSDDLLSKIGFGSDQHDYATTSDIILSTLDILPNMDIERHYGLVSGRVYISRNPLKELIAGFKNFYGGDNKGVLNGIEDARSNAINNLINEAKGLGANAIIAIKFENLTISFSSIEVRVYGTAVKAVKF